MSSSLPSSPGRSGRPVLYARADAGDVSQGQAAIAETIDRFGRIDALVNRAGITTRGTMLDTRRTSPRSPAWSDELSADDTPVQIGFPVDSTPLHGGQG